MDLCIINITLYLLNNINPYKTMLKISTPTICIFFVTNQN